MNARFFSRLFGVSWLLSLWLGSFATRAQSRAYYEASLDSLRHVLGGQRTDTARLRTLQHLVNLQPSSDDELHHQTLWLQQLLPLLQQRPQARAYRLWLAGMHLGQAASQPPPVIRQAVDSLQAAVRAFDRLGWYSANLYYCLSTYYDELNQPAVERDFLSQQLAFYQRQPARWQQASSLCLAFLSQYYEAHGDFNRGLNCLLQQVEAEQRYAPAFAQKNDGVNLATIGRAYARWGNYAKAQQYFERALRAQPPADQLAGLALYESMYIEQALAEAYQRQHRVADALRLVNQALQQYPRASAVKDYPFNHIQLLLLKSSLLLDQRQPLAAWQLLRQSQRLTRLHKLDTINYLTTDGLWARYYAQQGQVAQAQAAWQRAYHRARATHSPGSVLYCARQVAQFYQAQHQPARATPYALVALHLADSLAAQQGSSLVASYELVQADRIQADRLATARRRQRQAVAQAQAQRRTLRYTGAGVMGLLLVAGILYVAFRRSRRLTQLVTAQKQNLQLQRDRLDTSLTDLRTTQQQLIQKEKMASLGELTAGIAHEIQNPLNFVNNFADVSAELVGELRQELTRGDLSEAHALADDLEQNLQKIHQHGSRASGIVRGMLEHSRASTGERQPTDVNVLGEEYLRLAYHGLRAKDPSFTAELQTDPAPNLPLVEAVPGDLGRVLLNLFTNAFYAVAQRQRTGEPGYVPTVSVRTQQVGPHVEIQVQDNGTGMSAEVQAKAFQPFFTTKPTGEGTGLGLSLSYDIITQGHGGTLAVESQVGQGSTFRISLPIA